MTRKFRESKEECLTIRKNCQDMIKTYQESEEIRSNSLDIELKKKRAELEEAMRDVSNLTQVKFSIPDKCHLLSASQTVVLNNSSFERYQPCVER